VREERGRSERGVREERGRSEGGVNTFASTASLSCSDSRRNGSSFKSASTLFGRVS
jgi:hypothetical protein